MQVGPRTCTRFLAFREISGICASKTGLWVFSATGLWCDSARNAAKCALSAMGPARSLTLATCWRGELGFEPRFILKFSR